MAKFYAIVAIITVFASLPDSHQDNAGIKVKLSQKGLNYAVDVLVDLLLKDLNNKVLDDVTGKKGDLKYEIRDINIEELSRPDFKASFNEEKQLLTWSLRNSRISASADWKYDWKKNRIIRIKDSGRLTASVVDISLELDWRLKYDSATGRPLIETIHCESRVGKIDLDFEGGSSFIYERIFKLIKSPLDRTIEIAMCKAAEKALNENASEELRTLEVDVDLAKDLVFNFKLVSQPRITNTHIESLHSGCIYLSGLEECSTDHPAMDKDSGNRMLSLSLSAKVINTLARKAFENGVIQATITSEDLPENIKDFFDTNCKTGTCMASFFKKIADKHPDSQFEIDFAATSPPSLTMKDSQLKGSLLAVAKVNIRKVDNKMELFTTSINTDFDLAARIDNGNVLIGEIITFKPKISLVNITTEDTSGKKIEFLGKLLGKMLVKKANSAARQGLPLLSIKNIGWKNTDISIEDGYLHLETDIIYNLND